MTHVCCRSAWWLLGGVLTGGIAAPAAPLFSTNATWALFKGTREASSPDAAAWRAPAFDDSGWTKAPAPFFYGENYSGGTRLEDMRYAYSTLFLRRTFVVTNLGAIGWLTLGSRCDDGFIAWINGVEVRRSNVAAGERAYNTFASSAVSEPIPFHEVQLTNVAAFLVAGTNVIAVQAFNTSLSSSDLVIDLSLAWWPPDHVPPTLASVSPPPSATLSNLTQVTVTFSEPVWEVHAYDLQVDGAPATNVTGADAVYAFTFAPPAYGMPRLAWGPGHGITDRAAPPNRFVETDAGASWEYDLQDWEPPRVVLLNPPPQAVLRHLRQIEVAFSEAVCGVDAGDLRVNNVPATGVTVRSPAAYVFHYSEPAAGVLEVSWAGAHGIVDGAPAANALGGGAWTYTLDPNAPLADVRLNEFLAGYAGAAGLRDEDGELQDWIELWNPGTNAVNLSGWALTDDAGVPDRWTFPPLLLEPRQYLVVFASGKDRRPLATNGPLHTNFKLSPDGEYLGLYDAESPRHVMAQWAPQFPEQRNDHSYGVDAAGIWRYFAVPTPGASNGLSAIEGLVAAPHFSVGHGFFDAPFELHLTTATPGAAIRYTTHGGAPSLAQGEDYTGPLRLDRTTVLRAAAFKAGMLPSTVETRTYLFLDGVAAQPAQPPGFTSVWGTVTADYEVDPNVTGHPAYSNAFKGDLMSVPSVSIVMDHDDLFGARGIYANPESTGLAWERPGSVEMLYADGRPGFQANCGVRIQGGVGRRPVVLKHSFRFLFKGDYGPARLSHPLFEGNPVTAFDTFVLRAGFNNSYVWNANDAARMHYLQDQWIRDAYRGMGQESGYGNFVHVYVNGLYWGLYNATERPSAPYCADHFGGDKSEWDAINSSEAIDGSKTAWTTLQNLANAGIADDTAYQAIQQYLNVTNLADYMLVNFYGGNLDWDSHNWYAARRRLAGAGFMFFCWDAERCLESPAGNDRTGLNLADKPSRLYSQLRACPEFVRLFGDRAHRHLFNDGILTPGRAKALFATLTNQIYRAMVGESARWGDKLREPPFTRDTDWLNGANCVHWEMGTFFAQRAGAFLNQLRAAGLYPSTVAPAFSPQHGGRVPRGFRLTLSAPGGTVYYTLDGTDPRVYHTGAVSPAARTWTGTPCVLDTTTTVCARTLDGGVWSALNEATYQVAELGSALRFSEIMYHPAGGDTYEFIELHNTGPTPADLGRMQLDGVTFVFMPGTFLAPGARLVLAAGLNPAAWAAQYPGVTPAGYFTGKLADGGERLALLDPDGRVLTAATYDDTGGWPTAPDGTGPSLEMLNPEGDPGDPAHWRASAAPHGTPGAPPAAASNPVVVLNEIMADNRSAVAQDGTYPDWIELHNLDAVPVALDGWSLSDDGDPRKFVFPAPTVLPPHGYLVVWCDAPTLAPPDSLHTGFGLDREGESVFLHDAAGTRVDALTIGLQVPDTSVGRLGGTWELTLPTPGQPNTPAALADPSALVINEWLANPPPGGEDWMELFNRDPGRPVALRGLWLATSNALFQVRSLSFAPPAGFAVLVADENPGVTHVDFKLPKEGGSLALYDPAAALLDQVAYPAQSSGVTRGRWPNGGTGTADFPNGGTPGASNLVVVYTGPRLHEVMARNRAAVQDSAGRMADWVELFNPQPTHVAFGGMSLSLDAPQPGQWVFPPDVLVPPNGHLVIWCDPTRAASTAVEPDLNCGHALEGESGGVYLFDAAGQQVDQVEYGFQVPDQSIGESAEGWRLLASPTPGAPNAPGAALGPASSLRVNEWMAHPAEGDDWFELFNAAPLPVDLGGMWLGDDPSQAGQAQFQVAPLSFIAAQGFVTFHADAQPSRGRDHVNFALDDRGEMIVLSGPATNRIDAVGFGLQAPGVSEGRLLDGASRVVAFSATPTPGESNYVPLDAPVVNELLSHADAPLEDAIELCNPTLADVAIGGWYLSDDAGALRKFRVPDGTVVRAGGHHVFYAAQLAGGTAWPVMFDGARGGQVWLSEADGAGQLTGRRATARYGGALEGESFGRHGTTVGVDFVALSRRTFGVDAPATPEEFRQGTGAANAPPRVGPVVVSELMYHPPERLVDGVLAEDHDGEFIELHNVSDATVTLSEASDGIAPWRLQEAVEFDFPAPATMAPRGYVLVVGFDPVRDPVAADAFRLKYGVAASVALLGPFRGRLDNDGEALELYQPDPAAAGPVARVLTERVRYGPRSPWPLSADGAGYSLQRAGVFAYGNEPTNWLASVPTPGRVNGSGTNIPPIVVREPADQTNYAGLSATLQVLADGTAPLSYQWTFNGAALAGEVNPALQFTTLRPDHAGAYAVVVTNALGAVTSRVAILTVREPLLEILEPPQPQTVVAGGTAEFRVLAVGVGTLTYQWRQNGALIPEATNAVLTLDPVQPVHAGFYTVDIANAASNATSPAALLTVLQPPVFLEQPRDQTVVAYTTARFSVVVGGTPPLRFQWRFNGASLPGATNATLTLSNVQQSHEGQYRVLAFNTAGSVSSSNASLHVLMPPTLTQQPQSVYVRIRPDAQAADTTNVTFAVAASSTSPMRHQWQFRGTNIPGATAATLTVSNVQQHHWGPYTAVVTDDIGAVTTAPAWLYPLVRPVFTQPPVSQTVAAGSGVTLSAAHSGWPPPFTNEWRLSITPLWTNVHHQDTTFFTFRASSSPGSQSYRAVVRNAATLGTPGVGSSLATVTTLADTDGDGIPDAWELRDGFDPANALDAGLDADGDGLANGPEYLAGTQPTNAQSRLRLDAIAAGDRVVLTFAAVSNRTYTIQAADDPAAGAWFRVTDIVARATNHQVTNVVPILDDPARRFYRVVTPHTPLP
ncbi:MAG: lamin tail domain-containing protein [Verrucomicrobia bacterium]|nr:lamin tail domain-containing protein [Verrucomicrobiota bacterium]